MNETPRIAACKQRQTYTRKWQLDLMSTCTQRPGYCCFAMWCSYCASYGLRKQALHGDLSRYLCCNGMCPCSGRMGESKCPEFCLCLETVLCFAQSVATTRWMVQDELQVETTQCDNCIIGTMVFLQYLSCICHILACFFDELREVAQFVDCLADIAWCTVCACMQTQHKAEMDHRDANPGAVPPPLPGMHPPGVQMIPMGAPPPPPPGYGYPPPQPGYGGPPPGAYAYPPPGAYPQQQYQQQQAPYPPPGAYPPPPPGYPYPQPGAYPGPPQPSGMYR